MSKISLKDFLDGYNAVEGLKITYIRNAIKEDYVPISTKIGVATQMVKNAIKKEDGVDALDETVLFINFCMAALLLYTNIDISSADGAMGVLGNYDLLKQNGALDALMDEMDSINDLKEFNVIYHQVADTERAKINNPAYIASSMLMEITGALNDGLLKLADTVEHMDEKKLISKLDLFKKEIQKAIK